MTAREVLLAWAKSPGFAAIHNGAATDEQVVDDLVAWLYAHKFELAPRAAVMTPYAKAFKHEQPMGLKEQST